jgi:hypothetical protein
VSGGAWVGLPVFRFNETFKLLIVNLVVFLVNRVIFVIIRRYFEARKTDTLQNLPSPTVSKVVPGLHRIGPSKGNA